VDPRDGGEVGALKRKESPHVLDLNGCSDSRFRSGSELDPLGFEVADVRGTVPRLLRSDAALARDLPRTVGPGIIAY